MATAHDPDGFATWIEQLLRERGYDIDSPRGGGKSRLADEAGVHRAAITRLLQRQSLPDLETMRRLAWALKVPVRDMLIRSGQLTAEELPEAGEKPPPVEYGGELTLEQAAVLLGIPESQREMFVKVASQFLPTAAEKAPGRRVR
ncbi:helix-turn-helix domain-containing protein [Streptomyces polyrhachis]|uniref:Helix-turn-helix domain-containing protein n=1 Tax=Streptomyces polyrhachis TaxID=1282885 RepID=A0ABW2GBN2_9ACTN